MQPLRDSVSFMMPQLFALVPTVWRYFRTMPLSKAFASVALLVTFACVMMFGSNMLVAFFQLWKYESGLYESASESLQTCKLLERDNPAFRYQHSIDSVCEEARFINSTYAITRAVIKTVKKWSTPWELVASVVSTVESKIGTISLLLYLAATFTPYVLGPPMNYLQNHYVHNQVQALNKRHPM